MEPDENTNADTPAPADSVPADKDSSERNSIDGCAIILFLFFALDVCVACGVVCGLLKGVMPLWGALLFGIPLGLVVFVLVFYLLVKAHSGSVDMMDFAITHVIIIVMAIILFPIFSQARSKARQATCFTNMRTLGYGLLLYAQDCDDTFPPAARWSDYAVAKLKPEQARNVFHCPDAASPTSYGFNLSLDRQPEAEPAVAEQVVMLFEANADNRNAAGDRNLVAHPYRHSGANNYAFADGHTKAIKAPAESTLVWQVLP